MGTDTDARLQQAGARWREANTQVAVVDFAAATAVTAADAAEVPLVHEPAGTPRRHRRAWLAVAAGVAAAVAATIVAVQLGRSPSVPPPASGHAAPLVGTQWQLAELHDADGAAIRLARGAGLDVRSSSTLTFNDGCTFSSGAVSIQAHSLEVGRLERTASACPMVPGNSAPESNLIATVLTGTVRWSIDGNLLTVTKPGVGTLTYAPNPITDPNALSGRWTLAWFMPADRGKPTAPARPADLDFDGGRVSGSDGCNAISGTVTSTRTRLEFSEMGGTLKNCFGGTAEPQARVIDAVLSGTVSWTIDADWSNRTQQLILRKEGVGTLAFDGHPLVLTPQPRETG